MKNNQYRNIKELQDLGYNIVTCPDCGWVVIFKTKVMSYPGSFNTPPDMHINSGLCICPHCERQNEYHEFTDLYQEEYVPVKDHKDIKGASSWAGSCSDESRPIHVDKIKTYERNDMGNKAFRKDVNTEIERIRGKIMGEVLLELKKL